jgi:hypothetical protein
VKSRDTYHGAAAESSGITVINQTLLLFLLTGTGLQKMSVFMWSSQVVTFTPLLQDLKPWKLFLFVWRNGGLFFLSCFSFDAENVGEKNTAAAPATEKWTPSRTSVFLSSCLPANTCDACGASAYSHQNESLKNVDTIL